MISHCEKLKYACSMMKVSISLPWSCTSFGLSQSAVGSSRERIVSTITIKHMAERQSPTMMMKPKIVEIQCGSSDMTQSIQAKLIVNAYRINPGADIFRKRGLRFCRGGRSCSSDQRASVRANRNQIMKYTTARTLARWSDEQDRPP